MVITVTMMRASEERFQLKSSLVPVYFNFCEVSETCPLRCVQLFGSCLWGASKVRGISSESLM